MANYFLGYKNDENSTNYSYIDKGILRDKNNNLFGTDILDVVKFTSLYSNSRELYDDLSSRIIPLIPKSIKDGMPIRKDFFQYVNSKGKPINKLFRIVYKGDEKYFDYNNILDRLEHEAYNLNLDYFINLLYYILKSYGNNTVDNSYYYVYRRNISEDSREKYVNEAIRNIGNSNDVNNKHKPVIDIRNPGIHMLISLYLALRELKNNKDNNIDDNIDSINLIDIKNYFRNITLYSRTIFDLGEFMMIIDDDYKLEKEIRDKISEEEDKDEIDEFITPEDYINYGEDVPDDVKVRALQRHYN